MDEDFNQVVSYTYDSWGNIISIKDENGSDISNNTNHIGNINSFKYRSYYYDNETNLYYLNSRYYNSEWGRFVNCDIGVDTEHLLGTNLYQYGYNNPVNIMDNEGTWPKWLKTVAIITFAVVAVAAVTLATAGTGTAAAVIAAGVLKGAATGAAVGVVTGAVGGAISHVVSTGSKKGVGKAAAKGAVTSAVTGAASGAVLGGISSAIKVAQAANSWSPGGTYKNGYDSMANHYQRQVIDKGLSKGKNIVSYTNDAINFSNRNSSVLQYALPGRSTMTPGFTSNYIAGSQGGWFTSSGKILTFWYK